MKTIFLLSFLVLMSCANSQPYCYPGRAVDQIERDIETCKETAKGKAKRIYDDPYEWGSEAGIRELKCMLSNGYGAAMFSDRCYGYER
jgi:hypothetical protein